MSCDWEFQLFIIWSKIHVHVGVFNFRDNGVELVFIGTKGGLTRFVSLVEELSDP